MAGVDVVFELEPPVSERRRQKLCQARKAVETFAALPTEEVTIMVMLAELRVLGYQCAVSALGHDGSVALFKRMEGKETLVKTDEMLLRWLAGGPGDATESPQDIGRRQILTEALEQPSCGYQVSARREESIIRTPMLWLELCHTVVVSDSVLGSRGYMGYAKAGVAILIMPGALMVHLREAARTIKRLFNTENVYIFGGVNDWIKKLAPRSKINQLDDKGVRDRVRTLVDSVNAMENPDDVLQNWSWVLPVKFGSMTEGYRLRKFATILQEMLNSGDVVLVGGVRYIAMERLTLHCDDGMEVHPPPHARPRVLAEMSVVVQQRTVGQLPLCCVEAAVSLFQFGEAARLSVQQEVPPGSPTKQALAELNDSADKYLSPTFGTETPVGLNVPTPLQCTVLSGGVANAQKYYDDLMEAVEKKEVPGHSVLPIIAPFPREFVSEWLDSIITWIPKAFRQCVTELQFDRLMLKPLRELEKEGIFMNNGNSIEEFMKRNVAWREYVEAEWSEDADQVYASGTRRTLSEICMLDIVAMIMLNGPARFVEGPAAITKACVKQPRGKWVIVQAMMTTAGRTFLFPGAKALLEHLRDTRRDVLKQIATWRRESGRVATLAELCIRLGWYPKQLESLLTTSGLYAVVGIESQKPIIMPKAWVYETVFMVHPAMYCLRRPCKPSANVPFTNYAAASVTFSMGIQQEYNVVTVVEEASEKISRATSLPIEMLRRNAAMSLKQHYQKMIERQSAEDRKRAHLQTVVAAKQGDTRATVVAPSGAKKRKVKAAAVRTQDALGRTVVTDLESSASSRPGTSREGQSVVSAQEPMDTSSRPQPPRSLDLTAGQSVCRRVLGASRPGPDGTQPSSADESPSSDVVIQSSLPSPDVASLTPVYTGPVRFQASDSGSSSLISPLMVSIPASSVLPLEPSPMEQESSSTAEITITEPRRATKRIPRLGMSRSQTVDTSGAAPSAAKRSREAQSSERVSPTKPARIPWTTGTGNLIPGGTPDLPDHELLGIKQLQKAREQLTGIAPQGSTTASDYGLDADYAEAMENIAPGMTFVSCPLMRYEKPSPADQGPWHCVWCKMKFLSKPDRTCVCHAGILEELCAYRGDAATAGLMAQKSCSFGSYMDAVRFLLGHWSVRSQIKFLERIPHLAYDGEHWTAFYEKDDKTRERILRVTGPEFVDKPSLTLTVQAALVDRKQYKQQWDLAIPLKLNPRFIHDAGMGTMSKLRAGMAGTSKMLIVEEAYKKIQGRHIFANFSPRTLVKMKANLKEYEDAIMIALREWQEIEIENESTKVINQVSPVTQPGGRTAFDIVERDHRPCALQAGRLVREALTKIGRCVVVTYQGENDWRHLFWHPEAPITTIDIKELPVLKMIYKNIDVWVVERYKMKVVERDLSHGHMEFPKLGELWQAMSDDTDEHKALVVEKAHDAATDAYMTLEIFAIVMAYSQRHQQEIDRVLRLEMHPDVFMGMLSNALQGKKPNRIPKAANAASFRSRANQLSIAIKSCSFFCKTDDGFHSLD